METNKCKLSDGAKAVLNLMEHEPTTPKFRTIDPKLIDKLETILDNARYFTDEKMEWLNGIFISFDKLHKVYALLGEIRDALDEGARFENSFWDGVEASTKARNSFMKTLMSGVESGNIILKQGNDNERPNEDGEHNDETDGW